MHSHSLTRSLQAHKLQAGERRTIERETRRKKYAFLDSPILSILNPVRVGCIAVSMICNEVQNIYFFSFDFLSFVALKAKKRTNEFF